MDERPPSRHGPAAVRAILTVAHLTIEEARRRRILVAALLLGTAFLVIFGGGLFFIVRDLRARVPPGQQRLMTSFVVMAALYAANFLIVVTSILVAVDTVAGEIASGVVETLCSKPVGRATILLGKWLGCGALLLLYQGFLVGGVLAVAWAVARYTPPHAVLGGGLMLLEGTVLLTLAVAGGTRLAGLANGVSVLGLYGLAFIGGWMEQIGTLLGNATARYLGIAASLVVPSESLWQLAAHNMQPPLARDLNLTPFSPASVPSPAMVVWALAYVLIVFTIGLRLFQRRDL
jgi:ABC-type transport system involved in multi-copper enzyme maturation permease subunit